MYYRIIIAGSRDFNDYAIAKRELDSFFNTLLIDATEKIDIEIISGTARGADTLGEKYAKENNIKLTRMPADWNMYGKAAGMIRNNQMASYASENGYVGYLVVFWDGISRGTKGMIDIAKRKELNIKTVMIK